MTEAPRFVSAGGNTGPFGREVGISELQVGDIIQLANSEGDYYHTLVVVGFSEGEPLVAAHSIDVLNRPLREYTYAMARYLHIIGVRVPVAVPDCFTALLAGRSLPQPL